MNDEKQLSLQKLIAAWSDGPGLSQATTLADKHHFLLPRRITNAQLYGLRSVVQVAANLGQVTAFAEHQSERASRTGRLDVKEYWDALLKALNAVGEQARNLTIKIGMSTHSGQEKGHSELPERLTIRLAGEFVQHLVAHSLYLGARST